MSALKLAAELHWKDRTRASVNRLSDTALCESTEGWSRYQPVSENTAADRLGRHFCPTGKTNPFGDGLQPTVFATICPASLISMSPEELFHHLTSSQSRRIPQDHRPDWLRRLTEEIAEKFEPLRDIARAGYDCRLDEHGWLLRMYLGTTEIIGGPKDGQIEHASFRMDLKPVLQLFECVDRFEWYSLTNTDPAEFDGDIRSLLTVTGTVDGAHQVRLELLASPPRCVGSSLHETGSGYRLP